MPPIAPRIARFAAIAAALVLGLGLSPRTAPCAPPAVDAATRKALVERVAVLLEQDYVFPAVGARYARALRDDLSAKRFDGAPDAAELARQLTGRLQAVSADGHLRIQPPDPNLPLPPTTVDISPGARANRDDLPLDSLPPEMRALIESRIATERQVNHFFRKVEILPGNVGYLDLDQFGFLPATKPAADAALAFLAETDALILDLRQNPGGIEGLNRYLCSRLVSRERPQLLYSRFTRPSGDTLETWTLPDSRAVDLSGKPLFILIDGRTGSAAENMSFALQGLHRATLVGERTAGAAHSSTPVGLPGGFRMILPISRAFNPRTGLDWEGVGVQPDARCASDSALVLAHALALDSLVARGVSSKQRGALEVAGKLFRAQSAPAGGPAAAFNGSDYEGSWGVRKVWMEGGKLWLQRTDRADAPRLQLLPSAPDEFMIERANRPAKFERDALGHVVRLRLQTPSDEWEVVERKAP